MIKRLASKTHLALGQTLMLLSVILMAMSFGLIPDRVSLEREGRAALVEAIAVSGSSLIAKGDLRALDSMLTILAERNKDISSVAVRRDNGETVLVLGDHEAQWRDFSDDIPTDTQVTLPIWSGNRQWGQIELRMSVLTASDWRGVLANQSLLILLFVGVACFIGFYLYLGRMLRHLNPNKAVPPHVRAALDTFVEGLLVIDRSGSVVLANESFAKLIGSTPDALIGRLTTQFAWTSEVGEAIPDARLPWMEAITSGVAQKNNMLQLRDGKGKQRSFIVNSSPVLGSVGRHGGVLVTFDDVTELEHQKVELEKAKESAESANRAKSAFLANMSHEIRTPMNAILGFTEVLKRGHIKSEADAKKHLNTIHSSGKHLLQLINDLLDLSKVEAGQLDTEEVEFAPHALVYEVVKLLTVRARENDIALDVRVDSEIPQRIRSDPTRVRQIVTNLIGNAIKFTEHGGVTVALRFDRADGANKYVIDVIDTGVGMRADEVESVFERFVQADSSIARRFGGTGLGLAISRKFARALGGDVIARSKLGEGSVFTATLEPGPLEGVDFIDRDAVISQGVETFDEPRGQWRFDAKRVLVVDDGAENRQLLDLVLGEVGLQVEQAENGQVAVEKASAESFDVILMDMQMPVMDGEAATALLRHKGLETPIIALTANAMKGFETKLLEVGCTGFLTKPVDVDELLRILGKCLDGEFTAAADVKDAAPAPEEELTPESVLSADDAPIVSRYLSAGPRFRPVIEKFVKTLDEQLDAIRDARDNQDYGAMADLAHWLRGSGGTVGFDEFTEPASELEEAANAKDRPTIDAMVTRVSQLAKRIYLPESSDEDGKNGKGRNAAAIAALMATSEQLRTSATESSWSADPTLAEAAPFDPIYVNAEFKTRFERKLTALKMASTDGTSNTVIESAQWMRSFADMFDFPALSECAVRLERLTKTSDEAGGDAAMAELVQLARRVEVAREGAA